jgi:CDP-diacylglycerol--serine O-phosphatidyltransferase
LKRPRRIERTRGVGLGRGITLRQVAPNAVTATALCFGLTAMRYGLSAEWDKAMLAIVFAAVLDGVDGRIARMLHGESRFGAELDSLSDVIAFGVSPAIILYLWSLQEMPRFGWIGALGLALCCALRLARFNAQIDTADQPLKLAGFNMGVPAPAGAGLALMPVFFWLATGLSESRDWRIVLPWSILVALLMVSNLPTLGWKRMRVPPSLRLLAIGAAAMTAALLFTAPWPVLTGLSFLYLVMLPIGWVSYRRVKRQRARVRTAAAQQLAPEPVGDDGQYRP